MNKRGGSQPRPRAVVFRCKDKMACKKCCIALLLVLGFCSVEGIPLAGLYTFGRTAGDASLRPNDDGSSPPISLNVSFPFFDMLHSTVYVRSLLYTYENHNKHGERREYAGACRRRACMLSVGKPANCLQLSLQQWLWMVPAWE